MFSHHSKFVQDQQRHSVGQGHRARIWNLIEIRLSSRKPLYCSWFILHEEGGKSY